MKHHRLGLCVLGVAGALLASTAALAGFRSAQPVVISDTGQFAKGDLGFIANTPDVRQVMGCDTYNGAGGCWARDATGLSRACSTSDPEILAVIRSMNGDSWVLFSWDTNGHCVTVEVENSSIPAVKQ